MVIAPFAFFPFSKTFFLAFDLLFRPGRTRRALRPGRRYRSAPASMELDFPGGRIRSWRAGDARIARPPREQPEHLAQRARPVSPPIHTGSTPRDGWRWPRRRSLRPSSRSRWTAKRWAGSACFSRRTSSATRPRSATGLARPTGARGSTTAAVRRFTDYAFDRFDLCRHLRQCVRLEPGLAAGCLEKAGYQFEGRLRQAASRTGGWWTGCCTRRCGSSRERQEEATSQRA